MLIKIHRANRVSMSLSLSLAAAVTIPITLLLSIQIPESRCANKQPKNADKCEYGQCRWKCDRQVRNGDLAYAILDVDVDVAVSLSLLLLLLLSLSPPPMKCSISQSR